MTVEEEADEPAAAEDDPAEGPPTPETMGGDVAAELDGAAWRVGVIRIAEELESLGSNVPPLETRPERPPPTVREPDPPETRMGSFFLSSIDEKLVRPNRKEWNLPDPSSTFFYSLTLGGKSTSRNMILLETIDQEDAEGETHSRCTACTAGTGGGSYGKRPS